MKVWDKFLSFMGFIDPLEEEEEEEQDYQEYQPEDTRKRTGKGQLVALHNNKDHVKVQVVDPKSFDDAQIIADYLKNRQAVVINLEALEYDLSKRIIDFVGGTTYAIDGSMQKIGKGVIIAVPPNVDISSDLKENYMEEQQEVFSWVSKFSRKGEK